MTDFRAKLGPAFGTMEAIATLVDELFQRNEGKAVLDSRRCASRAALGLYAKARKNVDALYRLAFHGYGEDAMILARSLVNMCIDLRFICGDRAESETRARNWIARGRVARRKFAARAGTVPPDETRIDWTKEIKLSDAWEKVSIWSRAEIADLTDFYNLPFRHGSTFEHSDSWSALAYVDFDETEARLLTVPSERFVDLALLTGCCTFAEVAVTFGRYFEYEMGGSIEAMEEAIRKGFPMDAPTLLERKSD